MHGAFEILGFGKVDNKCCRLEHPLPPLLNVLFEGVFGLIPLLHGNEDGRRVPAPRL